MMAKERLKKVNITVAGRAYPVLVNKEEESKVKTIEREVNDKISEYQLTYSNQEKIDCVSMTMLTYAFESHKMIHTKGIVSRLEHLDILLDEALNI